ncbi:unnamed protein product, partial [Mesorhabditis spiculigera]
MGARPTATEEFMESVLSIGFVAIIIIVFLISCKIYCGCRRIKNRWSGGNPQMKCKVNIVNGNGNGMPMQQPSLGPMDRLKARLLFGPQQPLPMHSQMPPYMPPPPPGYPVPYQQSPPYPTAHIIPMNHQMAVQYQQPAPPTAQAPLPTVHGYQIDPRDPPASAFMPEKPSASVYI